MNLFQEIYNANKTLNIFAIYPHNVYQYFID